MQRTGPWLTPRITHGYAKARGMHRIICGIMRQPGNSRLFCACGHVKCPTGKCIHNEEGAMATVDRWLLPDGIEEVLPPQAAQIEASRRISSSLSHY